MKFRNAGGVGTCSLSIAGFAEKTKKLRNPNVSEIRSRIPGGLRVLSFGGLGFRV